MGIIWRFTVEKLEFHKQKLDFLAMNQKKFGWNNGIVDLESIV
jgi:hypothetical protein